MANSGFSFTMDYEVQMYEVGMLKYLSTYLLKMVLEGLLFLHH